MDLHNPRELWDLQHFFRRWEVAQQLPPSEKGFAVLVTTGALNPIHLGHVQMMEQARLRAEREGFTVLGGWISPSSDFYVGAKMDRDDYAGAHGFALPIHVRAECVRLAVLDFNQATSRAAEAAAPTDPSLAEAQKAPALDAPQLAQPSSRLSQEPWLALGLWEGVHAHDWPDFGEVAVALESYLFARTAIQDLTVFYVSGEDHFLRCRLSRGLGHVGVISVPRSGEAMASVASRSHGAQPAASNVFTADPLSPALSHLSATGVRRSMHARDAAALATMLSPSQLTYILSAPLCDLMRTLQPPRMGNTERKRFIFLSLDSAASCTDPAALATGLFIFDCARPRAVLLPTMTSSLFDVLRAAENEGRILYLREGLEEWQSEVTNVSLPSVCGGARARSKAGWGWYWRAAEWINGHIDFSTQRPFKLPALPNKREVLTAKTFKPARYSRYTFVFEAFEAKVFAAMLMVECPTLVPFPL